MTIYVVRWYIPVLAQWIDVSKGRTLEEARESELFFRKKMLNVWVGDLQLGIVEIREREIAPEH